GVRIEISGRVVDTRDQIADDEYRLARAQVRIGRDLNPVVAVPDLIVDEPDVFRRVLPSYARAERRVTRTVMRAEVFREDHVRGLLHPETALLVLKRAISPDVDVVRLGLQVRASGIDLNAIAAVAIELAVDDPQVVN